MSFVFGLIGFPLTHSFSPSFFTEKFRKAQLNQFVYKAFPLSDIHQFPELLEREPYLRGLNVTLPYKEQIIPFIDDLSPEAVQVGAVNTIAFEDGKMIGYNTDVWGLEKTLSSLIKNTSGKVLILGSGGASKAVQFVCRKLGLFFQIVSRKNKENTVSYSYITNILHEFDIIVNTTPVGMHPAITEAPAIPYDRLLPGQVLYDLIYNPPVTEFMTRGSAKGTTTKNGMEMLILQAEKAWEIWNKNPLM